VRARPSARGRRRHTRTPTHDDDGDDDDDDDDDQRNSSTCGGEWKTDERTVVDEDGEECDGG